MHNIELWYHGNNLSYIFQKQEEGWCNLMYDPPTCYTEDEYDAIRSILYDGDYKKLAPVLPERA